MPLSSPSNPTAPTLDQIVEAGARLHPKRTLGNRVTDFESVCSTSIFTHVTLPDGTVQPLNFMDGRYGVVYCRVSTDDQVAGNRRLRKRESDDDTRAARMREKRERVGRGETDEAEGLSVQFQIKRCAEYFIGRGQAFKIYSDVSLSGGLPPMIPNLITSMYVTKAEGYRKAFNAVFGLGKKSGTEKNPDDRTERLIAYRDAQIEKIIRGGYKVDTHGITGTVEIHDKRAIQRTKPYYRPALTALLASLSELHTVAVTDITRLSRAHELTVEVMKRFSTNAVEIVGTIESTQLFNSADEDWGADIASTVLSKVAERKITEQANGAMRGALRKLEQGKPPNALPWWLTKGTDGKAVVVPERVDVVKDVAHRYLAGESLYEIANRLNRKGLKSPWGTDWRYDTLRKWLGEKAIIGVLEFFGLEWPIYPPLIPVEMWERIQVRLHTRGTAYAKRIAKKHPTRLLSGLLRCAVCGKSLTLKRSGNQRGQIKYGCVVGHPLLPADDLDAFVSNLMKHHVDDLLSLFRSGYKGQELQGEIEALKERREELSRIIGEKREEVRPDVMKEAREYSGDVGFDLEEGEVKAVIEVGFRKRLAPLYTKDRDLQELLKAKQVEYDLMMPPPMVAEIEETARQWEDLDADQRNRLVKQVFLTLEHVVTAEGEGILPRLKTGTGVTLPLIPVAVSQGPSNQHGVTYRRAIPTAEEWRRFAWFVLSWVERRENAKRLSDDLLSVTYGFRRDKLDQLRHELDGPSPVQRAKQALLDHADPEFVHVTDLSKHSLASQQIIWPRFSPEFQWRSTDGKVLDMSPVEGDGYTAGGIAVVLLDDEVARHG